MNRVFLFLSLLAVSIVASQGAKADYFFWKEPKSGLTMTFPDTWERQSNRNPDEVLRISGPSNGDNPVCTVKITGDNRYTIFPPDYGDAVQRVAVSIPFWKSYMGNYDQYVIDRVFDGGGLGRWRASYAFAGYTTRDGTAYQQRRGIMFASLYNDKLYVVECSTLNHAYERWNANFRSIIKSIDFKKMYHEHMTGDYANFLEKRDKYFWQKSQPDTPKHEQYFWAQTGPEGTTAY